MHALQPSTPITLVRKLFSRAGGQEPRIEVFRLKEGSGPPLFAVHASGGILSFAKLARHLHPEQPFYVLKGERLDSPRHPFADIYDLTRRYAKEIADLSPGGPYMICGRHSETVVETGQQLMALGKRVPLTIIFDSRPPRARKGLGPLPRRIRQLRLNLPRMLSLSKDSDLPLSTAGLPLRDRIRIKWFVELRSHDRPKYINNGLLSNYEPRPYNARVVYIQSEEFGRKSEAADFIDRWRSMSDELVCHHTPGGHTGMYERPHVQMLARLVQLECDRTAATREVT